MLWELPKGDKRHKVSKCYWNNGASRLALFRVATNLQFVRNAGSAKQNNCTKKPNTIK